MIEFLGRGGSGAPLRDANGNVRADLTRRSVALPQGGMMAAQLPTYQPTAAVGDGGGYAWLPGAGQQPPPQMQQMQQMQMQQPPPQQMYGLQPQFAQFSSMRQPQFAGGGSGGGAQPASAPAAAPAGCGSGRGLSAMLDESDVAEKQAKQAALRQGLAEQVAEKRERDLAAKAKREQADLREMQAFNARGGAPQHAAHGAAAAQQPTPQYAPQPMQPQYGQQLMQPQYGQPPPPMAQPQYAPQQPWAQQPPSQQPPSNESIGALALMAAQPASQPAPMGRRAAAAVPAAAASGAQAPSSGGLSAAQRMRARATAAGAPPIAAPSGAALSALLAPVVIASPSRAARADDEANGWSHPLSAQQPQPQWQPQQQQPPPASGRRRADSAGARRQPSSQPSGGGGGGAAAAPLLANPGAAKLEPMARQAGREPGKAAAERRARGDAARASASKGRRSVENAPPPARGSTAGAGTQRPPPVGILRSRRSSETAGAGAAGGGGSRAPDRLSELELTVSQQSAEVAALRAALHSRGGGGGGADGFGGALGASLGGMGASPAVRAAVDELDVFMRKTGAHALAHDAAHAQAASASALLPLRAPGGGGAAPGQYYSHAPPQGMAAAPQQQQLGWGGGRGGGSAPSPAQPRGAVWPPAPISPRDARGSMNAPGGGAAPGQLSERPDSLHTLHKALVRCDRARTGQLEWSEIEEALCRQRFTCPPELALQMPLRGMIKYGHFIDKLRQIGLQPDY